MPQDQHLRSITNALISSTQLHRYQAAQNSSNVNNRNIFDVALLTQTAGVLLRLPQEVIATSIIILQRFLVVDALQHVLDTSFSDPSTALTQFSAASTYIAAKQSFYPLTPRSIINVYALMQSDRFPSAHVQSLRVASNGSNFYVSEGQYQTRRMQLFDHEKTILSTLGFDTKVVLPYTLALTYLQALSADSSRLCERVLAYLNTSLLSPQMLHVTHQPNMLAAAAIYLGSRELEISLTDDEVPWWEVFDVGREELGFLVLSLGSVGSFAEQPS